MVNFISLVITLFLVCISLVGSVPVASEAVRVTKRTTDWGNYVFIASQASGVIGQNLGLIASPGVCAPHFSYPSPVASMYSKY